jgi:dTMP kinase
MNKFITFEGIDGSGKSTQAKMLHDAIGGVLTREPGGTLFAEKIRSILVESSSDNYEKETELLLFAAARLDHTRRIIQPALKEGKNVVCDRYFDSTLAYQGYGRGYDRTLIKSLYQSFLGDFAPNITFIFDIDPKTALARTNSRTNNENRFEAEGLLFYEKIRQGFLEIAKNNPSRCHIIDASEDVATIAKQIISII